MLLRISLIVAILAGLGAGVVSYMAVTDKIPTLQKQRDDEHTAKVNEIAAHSKTKTELKKTQADLAQTQQELSDTKTELAKTTDRADKLQKRADDLSDKLAKVTSERDDAQNSLAEYKATQLTPPQVYKLAKDLKDARSEIEVVNGEKVVLLHTITRLTNELAKYIGPEEFVKLPAELHGKVLVVDPKWDFVVLNIGEDQGVVSAGELLVSRQGKLVGKVIVRSVEKDRCIANLVPGWKLGDFFEGDEVSPAHPAS
jgi:flagellar motility protein MotE (MotC chaperone)